MSGLPKVLEASTAEIRKAIAEPVSAIVDAVKTTLDKTPPELGADIMEQGIVLTGGGALLQGLGARLQEETGIAAVEERQRRPGRRGPPPRSEGTEAGRSRTPAGARHNCLEYRMMF